MPRLSAARMFYDAAYATSSDPRRNGITSYPAEKPEQRHAAELRQFVAAYQLENARVLDVGSGAGGFQDLVADYSGVDIAATAARFYHKPFAQASAMDLPFPDDSFDVVWTVACLEHVSEPACAYAEMRRVLRPGGLLYLFPAWQCESWFADGYAVRPWSDFGWKGKLIKASIPLRDNPYYRAVFKIPFRLWRIWWYRRMAKGWPSRLYYRTLRPNYEINWTLDSDAVNQLDPAEAILWFTTRGDHCLTNPTVLSQVLARNAPVILQKEPAG